MPKFRLKSKYFTLILMRNKRPKTAKLATMMAETTGVVVGAGVRRRGV